MFSSIVRSSGRRRFGTAGRINFRTDSGRMDFAFCLFGVFPRKTPDDGRYFACLPERVRVSGRGDGAFGWERVRRRSAVGTEGAASSEIGWYREAGCRGARIGRGGPVVSVLDGLPQVRPAAVRKPERKPYVDSLPFRCFFGRPCRRPKVVVRKRSHRNAVPPGRTRQTDRFPVARRNPRPRPLSVYEREKVPADATTPRRARIRALRKRCVPPARISGR